MNVNQRWKLQLCWLFKYLFIAWKKSKLTILLVFIIIASQSLFYIQFYNLLFIFLLAAPFLCLSLVFSPSVLFTQLMSFQSLTRKSSPDVVRKLLSSCLESGVRSPIYTESWRRFSLFGVSTTILPWTSERREKIVPSCSSGVVRAAAEEVKTRHSIHLTTTSFVLCLLAASLPKHSSNWIVKSLCSSFWCVHSLLLPANFAPDALVLSRWDKTTFGKMRKLVGKLNQRTRALLSGEREKIFFTNISTRIFHK